MMNEKYEALALSQLLVMHADNIENPDVQNMVINAATELAVLHAENERLREALTYDWDQLEACVDSLGITDQNEINKTYEAQLARQLDEEWYWAIK